MRVYQFRHAGIVGIPEKGKSSYPPISCGASIIPDPLGQALEMRCLHQFVALAGKVHPSMVVDHHEQNIRPLDLRRLRLAKLPVAAAPGSVLLLPPRAAVSTFSPCPRIMG